MAWRTTANVSASFPQAIGIDSAREDVPPGTVKAMVATAAPPRLATARTPARPTLGQYVADIGKWMEMDFHDWQRLLSDVSCELVPRANPFPGQSSLRFNYQYVGAMVGRQSGKSAWSASRIVAQCLLPNFLEIADQCGLDEIKPQHVVYTAQSRTNAVQRWLEHIDIINSYEALREEIKVIRYATGREIIEFNNGSTYRPVTPNRTGARGLTLDLVIVDEALAHPLWLLSVLRPTMAQRDSASGCIGAQFVVISNAGDDDSELLNRMQELGIESLADPDSKRAWFEWSADPEADPFAEQTWIDTCPTLNQPNGIDIEFLRLEAQTMREDMFIREYLCRRSIATHDQIIPMELWMDLNRPDVMVPMDGLVLGLDIRMDRMGASLMACGAVDTYLPIEIVEARQGLDWVLERTVEVARRWNAPVAIDVGGPGANLIPSLESHGITIVPLAAREVTLAAASFYDNCYAKRICHMNDYRLNDAITGASRRAVGDRWAFDRRGHWDISPLVAASLAGWVVETGMANRPTIY